MKLIYVMLICSGLYILYLINPENSWIYPKCPFKLISGYNCPGCGIQRSIYWFLHGEFKKAIHYNYFLLLAVPYALGFLACLIMPSSNIKRVLCTFLNNRYVVIVFLTVCWIWFIIRNFLNL